MKLLQVLSSEFQKTSTLTGKQGLSERFYCFIIQPACMHTKCITSDPFTLQGCITSSVADKIAVTATEMVSLCGKSNGLYC
jgi:hypothetical protein